MDTFNFAPSLLRPSSSHFLVRKSTNSQAQHSFSLSASSVCIDCPWLHKPVARTLLARPLKLSFAASEEAGAGVPEV